MKITKKLIEKTIQTGNTSLLPVFTVIKDKETNIIDSSTRTIYTVVTRPTLGNCVEIDKKSALTLIGLYSLQPLYKTKDGTVYDTIDERYRKKYHGYAVNI